MVAAPSEVRGDVAWGAGPVCPAAPSSNHPAGIWASGLMLHTASWADAFPQTLPVPGAPFTPLQSALLPGSGGEKDGASGLQLIKKREVIPCQSPESFPWLDPLSRKQGKATCNPNQNHKGRGGGREKGGALAEEARGAGGPQQQSPKASSTICWREVRQWSIVCGQGEKRLCIGLGGLPWGNATQCNGSRQAFWCCLFLPPPLPLAPCPLRGHSAGSHPREACWESVSLGKARRP